MCELPGVALATDNKQTTNPRVVKNLPLSLPPASAQEANSFFRLRCRDEISASKRTAVTLTVGGNTGVLGSVVRVLLDAQGKPIATEQVSGGDGRGGQRSPQARFALDPGNYRVEVRDSNGVKRTKEITVAQTPMRAVIDEKE